MTRNERDRLRVGVVGLGRIGRIHAANLAGRVGSAELAGVADVRGVVAAQVGQELGTAGYDDHRSLLEHLDAVIVASSTPTHVQVVRDAVAAGVAVFCEKPLSEDIAESAQLCDDLASASLPCQVGLHRRFDPDWQEAARRIHAGELGRVYLLRTSLRDMVPQPIEYIRTSGSFFVDVTIHDLDMARWLVGEIDEVDAHGAALVNEEIAKAGAIDQAAVVLTFANGAIGLIDNSRAAGYGYEASTEVLGSEASVRIDQPRRHHLEWRTPAGAQQNFVTTFVERFAEAYRAEVEAFVECVRRGTPISVGPEDAHAALMLARACDVSLERGERVQLTRDDSPDPSTPRYAIASS